MVGPVGFALLAQKRPELLMDFCLDHRRGFVSTSFIVTQTPKYLCDRKTRNLFLQKPIAVLNHCEMSCDGAARATATHLASLYFFNKLLGDRAQTVRFD